MAVELSPLAKRHPTETNLRAKEAAIEAQGRPLRTTRACLLMTAQRRS
jgi:hypothetical protein